MSLHLTLKDFGPIAAADFSLASLNVFVGPNNTGKSVAAMAVYATRHVARPAWSVVRGRMDRRDGFGTSPLWDTLSDRERRSLLLELRALADTDEDVPFSPELARYAEAVARDALASFGEKVLDSLQRVFNAPVHQLDRTQRGFVLDVATPGLGWNVRIRSDGSVRASDPPPRRTLEASFIRWWRDFSLEPDDIGVFRDFSFVYAWSLFGRNVAPAAYLPAERSGLLHSYRALASYMVERSAPDGTNEPTAPANSGVMNDFVSQLIRLEPDEIGPLNPVARELERTVMRGKVELTQDNGAYPRLTYVQGKRRFPIHRTSSMVSELAPIVLYLRHVVRPGGLLVIEEPEAHLHPQLQVNVADAVVRLARSEVDVVVTTHSEFFLTRINNAVRAAAVEQSGGVHVVPAEAVTAYLFAPGPRAATTRVRRIEVSDLHGISDDDFAQVAASLYEDLVSLEERLVD